MSTFTSSFSFCGPVLAFVSIALRMPAASPLPFAGALMSAELGESAELLEPPQAATVSASATSVATTAGERRIKTFLLMQDARFARGTCTAYRHFEAGICMLDPFAHPTLPLLAFRPAKLNPPERRECANRR